jgi:hypothetical protein
MGGCCLKARRDRRHGLPIEYPFMFYTRFAALAERRCLHCDPEAIGVSMHLAEQIQ